MNLKEFVTDTLSLIIDRVNKVQEKCKGKSFLYFIFLVCFIACSSNKENSKPTFEQAIEIASKSPNIKDSLFLGFNFGMDSANVMQKVANLLNENKLLKNKGNLNYRFNINSISYNSVVGFAYDKDTLSQVSLVFFPENSFTIELIKNSITAHTTKTFLDKGYSSYKKDNIFGTDDYYFIKNNTIISIIAYEHFVLMSYSNAIVDMREKLKKQEEKQAQVEQTLSDI